ncbi:DUF2066 domain-containing protein [Ferrovibrio terrae]|uniref:DUF2066 domain-containing protein n=1 Tax=Ferrovibrio terrae TaxID=2594003 RepID=UPI0031382274
MLFASFLAFGAGLDAHAQTTPQSGRPVDPFNVAGIAVDASADSAAAARPVALAEGQRRAFTVLLRRLTLPDDAGRLPRPSEAVLNEVVGGFGIDEERASATRYIGKISVQFRADAVRRLLQDNKLPYSETPSRPVLLVPLWQSAAGAKLWEADNPWREAWLKRPDAEGGLVPLSIAPAMTNGPSIERLLGSPDELRALTRRGGFADVLVLAATLQQADPGNIRVEIQMQHQGEAAFLDRIETFTATGGTQEETLLTAAIEIARRIETRWKYATVIDLEKQGQLSVAAGFAGLAEWNTLRNALAAVPIVRKVEVLQVSHRDAQILLDFYGETEQLSTALAQRDVSLQQRDGFWVMRSRKP